MPAHLQRLHQSLIFRAGITMLGISVLAIASMLTSAIIADTARRDAVATNRAGALRMQSFRLATSMDDGPAATERVQQLAEDFQHRLDDPIMRSQFGEAKDPAVADAYARVRHHWSQTMRPLLAGFAADPDGARQRYFDALEGFLAEIDRLIALVQLQADERLQLLRLLQGVALLLTIGLIFIAMYKLITAVAPPLRELFNAVNRARGGDFSIRPQYRGQDEIGLLSYTYNLMADDLSRLYASLEQRVADKTAELTQSNQALRLLYTISRQLSRQGLKPQDYQAILEEVAQVLAVRSVTLCLTTDNAARADALNVPVREADRQYGVILVQHAPNEPPAPWQVELLEAVAAQFATAFSLERQREQQHRLALMDERAVIARELHDSLAQSLSYLKIQVARLQTLLNRNGAEPDEATAEVIAELKEGLSSAYRQLRELLSTFRLKMDASGLRPALQATALEFSQRGKLQVELDYRLEHCPLSPNEEVHVLQVVREALSNVVHHSQADRAEIRLETLEDGEVRVSVLDNGIGIPDNWQRRNHYGMTIMQERAGGLHGRFSFRRRAEGGTEVELRFSPEAGVLPAAQPSTDTP